MAHFAKLDSNNVVIEVNVVNNAVLDPNDEEASGVKFLTSWSNGYSNWVQTSYNGNIRKQYAGVGYTYDADDDVFVCPQPYGSWTLDENHDWQPPTPMPSDASETKRYIWFEPNQQWIEIEEQ